jgi:hypothetical protein
LRLKGQFIWVEVRGRSDTERVRRLVEARYVDHARAAFARSLEASWGHEP